jgi:hypothetical protein
MQEVLNNGTYFNDESQFLFKCPLLHSQDSSNGNVHLAVRIEQEVVPPLILKKMEIHPNL